LRDGLVQKYGSAARQEAATLRLLHAHNVPVPRVTDCREHQLTLEHLSGEPLPDLIERGSYEPRVLAFALCDWFAAFYAAMPGLSRGDVNGRNFLYDGVRIVSVDFEDALVPGSPAHDAGRLAAFLVTYDTHYPALRADLTTHFTKEFATRFGCSTDEIREETALELVAMQKRRA